MAFLVYTVILFAGLSLLPKDLMLWLIGIDHKFICFFQTPEIWRKPNSDNFDKCIARPKNRISMSLCSIPKFVKLFIMHDNIDQFLTGFSNMNFISHRNRIENKWLSAGSCQWRIESNENRGNNLPTNLCRAFWIWPHFPFLHTFLKLTW